MRRANNRTPHVCIENKKRTNSAKQNRLLNQDLQPLPVPTSEPAFARCTRVCGIEGQESGQDQSLIIPVWVSNSEDPENKRMNNALLDCQSNATFVTEKLRQELGIEGVKSHLLLCTLHE